VSITTQGKTRRDPAGHGSLDVFDRLVMEMIAEKKSQPAVRW